MDPNVKAYATTLYQRSLFESAQRLKEERVQLASQLAARPATGPNLLGGPEIQANVPVFVRHIERCMEGKLASYRKAFADAARVPTDEEFREIWQDIEDAQAIQVRHSNTALRMHIRQRGGIAADHFAEADRTDELTQGSAYGHDRVLSDFKVWRGETHLKAAIKPNADEDSAARAAEGKTEDRKFERLAIEEARRSVPEDERAHPRVGVVVVKDGRVLATAHRGEILRCHAEYIALEGKLSEEPLFGATVHTTLEPCTSRNHPKVPCATRLAERKVTRVVIGMLDPDDRISGRGQRALRKAGIETELFPHDLMAEVEDLNRDFMREREAVYQELLVPNHRATKFPRVHVAVGEADNMGFPGTGFVLRNLGDEVAHKVQVEPLRVSSGEAIFPKVETIPINEERSVLPVIEQFGVLQQHDLSHLMMKAWDAAGEVVGEFSRPMKVVYEDYMKNRFESTFDLVYLPLTAIGNRNHPSLLPGRESAVFDVRNLEIRKL